MEKYSFFNDIDYFAEDLTRFVSLFFGNGIFNNGLMVVSNDDMTVSVKPGDALINGYNGHNDNVRILKIENADGVLDRIDNIVVRWDLTNREIGVKVIQGDFSEEPVAPELVRNSTIYDLRIAKINIPAGTTTITQDLIEDTRFLNSDCGNVISPIETPDTEELYAQLYAKAKKLIKDSQKSFENWFETVKSTLAGDVAGNLINLINDNQLKSYTTTLIALNWTLNEETGKYEYDVVNDNITSNHYVIVDPITFEDDEKFTGKGKINSYDGGFKIISTNLPEEDIEVQIVYELAKEQIVINDNDFYIETASLDGNEKYIAEIDKKDEKITNIQDKLINNGDIVFEEV